jgi:hypothetical protein
MGCLSSYGRARAGPEIHLAHGGARGEGVGQRRVQHGAGRAGRTSRACHLRAVAMPSARRSIAGTAAASATRSWLGSPASARPASSTRRSRHSASRLRPFAVTSSRTERPSVRLGTRLLADQRAHRVGREPQFPGRLRHGQQGPARGQPEQLRLRGGQRLVLPAGAYGPPRRPAHRAQRVQQIGHGLRRRAVGLAVPRRIRHGSFGRNVFHRAMITRGSARAPDVSSGSAPGGGRRHEPAAASSTVSSAAGSASRRPA